jgi:hypothetical protein
LAVPLPAGRPLPSGNASMFQAVMSASVIGWPSFGDSAIAIPVPNATVKASAGGSLRVDMLDPP